MFLTTPQPCQCSARATGSDRRIVDLPNYSRGQTTERLYLNGTCTETSRFKPLVPFVIAKQFIIAKPRRTGLFYRLLITSYYSKRNYGSSMEEGTQRAGEYSNNDIYFNAGTYTMNGGRGARHEQAKDLQPFVYLLFTVQALNSSTYRTRRHKLPCKKPQKRKGRTGPVGL